MKKEGYMIVVSIENYAKNLEKIEIRKRMPDDPLTEVEMKVFENMLVSCHG